MTEDRVKYRLKFEKIDRIRFIGHLDLLNLFQRSFKRSKLPIAYSQGFNPHQEMSFALPLSLGYGGLAEYLDIKMAQAVDSEAIRTRLNQHLPPGVKILQCRALAEGEKSAASLVRAAKYQAVLPQNQFSLAGLKEFMNQPHIVVEKKTKKKTAQQDIKDLILSASFEARADSFMLEAMLMAGPEKSVRIDTITEALYRFCGQEFLPYKIQYTRLELYRMAGEDYVSLMADL